MSKSNVWLYIVMAVVCHINRFSVSYKLNIKDIGEGKTVKNPLLCSLILFVQDILSIMCCIFGVVTFQGFWYILHGEHCVFSTDINSCEQCECGRTHTYLSDR